MFKRLAFIFILFLALRADAQFKVDEDTLYAHGTAGATSSTFIDIEADTKIRNIGSTVEVIKWIRVINQLPDTNWSTAICDIISCRSPEVDTGSFSFGPGDTGTLFFHFYPKNIKGNGQMMVKFYRESNPLEYFDVYVNVEVWKTDIVTVKNSISRIYPNPAYNSLVLCNESIKNGELEVINSLGQVIMKLAFDGEINLDIENLNPGMYTFKISNSSNMSTGNFIKL